MNTVPLTKGYVAVIDEADCARANQFVWTAMVVKGRVYAARRPKIDGKRQWVFLHRWLIGASDDADVDHRDGDSLNCRRENLRSATRSQNTANSHKVWGSVPFRGVSYDKYGRFRAEIRVMGRAHNLGSFDTAEEAAEVYRMARLRLFGEFSPDALTAP